MQNNNELPKIPEITFVVSKGNIREEYGSYKEFRDWFYDECDKELCQAYKEADGDSKRGCDGIKEWIDYTFTDDDYLDFLDEKGWKFERVVKK
ncbi:MAG TPA: hypothetical protein PK522_00790 [Nitrosomonas sp.]|nr:hypothetical protein [Nitrosomonas sp.]